jgi:hypothetical protein
MAFCKSVELSISPALTIEQSQDTTSTLAPEPLSERTSIVRSQSGFNKDHGEKHSEYGDVIRDVIIGFADGLTVPFALTAGLSSYVVPYSIMNPCLQLKRTRFSKTSGHWWSR